MRLSTNVTIGYNSISYITGGVGGTLYSGAAGGPGGNAIGIALVQDSCSVWYANKLSNLNGGAGGTRSNPGGVLGPSGQGLDIINDRTNCTSMYWTWPYFVAHISIGALNGISLSSVSTLVTAGCPFYVTITASSDVTLTRFV